MLVKVCGMKYAKNITQVAELQPSYIGFIFYKKSIRYFNQQIPKLPDTIKKVGVFVNETVEQIKKKVTEHKLQAVQLHGTETVDFCRQLKAIFPKIELIKAFSVDEKFDLKKTVQYESFCTCFLLDTKGKLYGGNGVKFNWDILKKYKGNTPFLLSGGITKEDAEDIKKIKHPQFIGVDVNSGFEIEPALKNIEDLKQFKQNLK